MSNDNDSDKALAGEINASHSSGQPAGQPQNQEKQPSQVHGFMPGSMPHIPTARERAREFDIRRRGSAHTFEL